MQQNWLDSVVQQPFQLTEHGIEFSALTETLEQQLQRDFVTLLPNRGILTVAGPDAATFLQGQLSCDLGAVTPQLACRGSHNTPKGRVIADFVLMQSSEYGYQCALPTSALPLLQQSLARYIVFSKAELEDISADHVVLGLSGESSAGVVATHFATVPEAPLEQVTQGESRCLRLEGDRPRYQLVLTQADATDIWRKAREALGTAHSSAWLLQDIRAGIANIVASTSENFIPQMLNYDRLGAISFNKGCYTGQEVIARAHYKGAVKRRIQGFRCDSSDCPAPGSPVFAAGSNAGQIVSAVAVDPQRIEGLVVVAEDPNQLLFLSADCAGASLDLIPLHYS